METKKEPAKKSKFTFGYIFNMFLKSILIIFLIPFVLIALFGLIPLSIFDRLIENRRLSKKYKKFPTKEPESVSSTTLIRDPIREDGAMAINSTKILDSPDGAMGSIKVSETPKTDLPPTIPLVKF